MTHPQKLNAQHLRRIALNQQGLLKSNTFGSGLAGTLKAIEHIAYIQIDTISVVERAHHHVLKSRISNYKPEFIATLVKQRKVFEYWFHAASWLPMRDYRFALPRMQALKSGEKHWTQNSDKRLRKEILARIVGDGPMRSRDFEDSRLSKNAWWDWKPAKHALEQLFMQGELMVSRREGFQKVYDLTENVLPADIDTTVPSTDEFAEFLLDTNLKAHGFISLKGITYLRKGQALRQSVKTCIDQRLDKGALLKIQLPSGAEFFISPELLDQKMPRCSASARILSPFDNALIQRERGRQIFDFDYQIECYVPEKKRQFGYFCLPILYKDQMVGRMDCKAHRKDRLFEVNSTHMEKPVDKAFPDAINKELQRFIAFNQCDQIIGDYRW